MYCQQSDLLGEISSQDLIALTDDAQPPTGNVNAQVLNAAISNASGEVDSYLANIYAVPFGSPIPTAVVSMTVIITCYRLYRRRLTPDEHNRFFADYERVAEFLKRANNGEAHIDQAPFRTYPQGAASTRPILYAGSIFGGGCLANSM